MTSLRNVKVREFISALERDGFIKVRQRGSHAIYRKGNRRVVLVIHSLGDIIPIGTLKRDIKDAGWEEEDLKRLKLIK